MQQTSFGKSIPLQDPHKGRALQEFEGKKLDPQTKVEVSPEGLSIVAKKLNVIASEIGNFSFERRFKRKEDGSIMFFWGLKLEEGIRLTLSEITALRDLLTTISSSDYQNYLLDYGPKFEKNYEVSIDFETSTLFLTTILSFEKEWDNPGNVFVEVK